MTSAALTEVVIVCEDYEAVQTDLQHTSVERLTLLCRYGSACNDMSLGVASESEMKITVMCDGDDVIGVEAVRISESHSIYIRS